MISGPATTVLQYGIFYMSIGGNFPFMVDFNCCQIKVLWKNSHPYRSIWFYSFLDFLQLCLHARTFLFDFSHDSPFENVYDFGGVAGFGLALIFKLNTIFKGKSLLTLINAVGQLDCAISGTSETGKFEMAVGEIIVKTGKTSNKIAGQQARNYWSTVQNVKPKGRVKMAYTDVLNLVNALKLIRSTDDFPMISSAFLLSAGGTLIPIGVTMMFFLGANTPRYVYGWLPLSSKSPSLLLIFTCFQFYHIFMSWNHVLFYMQMAYLAPQLLLRWLAELKNSCRSWKCIRRRYIWIAIFVGRLNDCFGKIFFSHAFGMAPLHIANNYMIVRYLGKISWISYIVFPAISCGCTFVAYTLYPVAGEITRQSIKLLKSQAYNTQRTKMDRQEFQSVPSLHFDADGFFRFSKTATSKYLSYVVKTTSKVLFIK
ncbi:unnamed protein product [Allacma fusca]|uniref:Uncharacterized protein n=1 Tax=Allacma fusca TaxID=39272 RepID=A0A8J2JXF9_9HEXA|nr:unnamed protein product [Allacma fusca]